jgi:SAM-dependent methyltransferase
MNFSRVNPSPRYLELQAMYRRMHQKGEEFLGTSPEHTFPGFSIRTQLGRIKALVERTGADTILDYGCGKGQQYEPHEIKDDSGEISPSVIDYWGIGEVVCYDPCYEPYSKLPEGKFDGVICTDVLEHCPEQDLPWIIEELFSYATRFVFANVACFPARKRLPNGENAHCTIQPVAWWVDLIKKIALGHPGVVWEFWVQSKETTPEGARLVEQKISSS